MAVNVMLIKRIRKELESIPSVEEQEKMGGVSFMIKGKMCVRAHSDGNMMIRCKPELTEELLTQKGVKRFEMKGKPMMRGWLLINTDVIEDEKNLRYWIDVALHFDK